MNNYTNLYDITFTGTIAALITEYRVSMSLSGFADLASYEKRRAYTIEYIGPGVYSLHDDNTYRHDPNWNTPTKSRFSFYEY